MTDQPLTIDLTKYIEVRLFGERPHILDSRVPVAAIAYNARTNGWGVERLMDEFGLSEAEVLAALLYYEQHRDHIDALEAAYQEALDREYRLHNGEN